MSKYEILIIDDNIELFETLEMQTKNRFNITYCDSRQCMRHEISDGRFDMIVLNFDLQAKNSFDLYRRLRQIYLGPIIFLSEVDDVHARIYGLEMGADAFILLPCDFHELELRIIKIIVHLQSSNTHIVGDYEIDSTLHQIKYQGRMLKMSMKSYQVMVYLLTHPNKDISRRELLFELWNNDTKYGYRVVDSTINVIRRLTKDKNIKSIRNVGYRYELED